MDARLHCSVLPAAQARGKDRAGYRDMVGKQAPSLAAPDRSKARAVICLVASRRPEAWRLGGKGSTQSIGEESGQNNGSSQDLR